MTKNKIKTKVMLSLAILALLIALIVNPPRYIQSVQNGLILFATNVLPALFPFFFFTKILTALGTATIMANVFRSPLKRLYNTPPISAYILIMSMLSGYPIGAKLTADFFHNGLITKSEARTISAFASTSGPLFILGTVASFMFKSTQIGYIIICSHYLGAIFNGLLYKNKEKVTSTASHIQTTNFDNMLNDSVTNSISNVLVVGSYIAIFSMIVDFFYDIKLINFFANTLTHIGIPYKLSESIFVSLIEVTRGLMLLANCDCSLKIIVPIACALLSLGGLSITLQSITFLAKCKISTPKYFVTKLTQSVLSFIFCSILSLIFL